MGRLDCLSGGLDISCCFNLPNNASLIMKTIPLTQGKVALVDDADYKSLNRYKWHVAKIHNICYAVRKIRMSDHKRRDIGMHRVVLNAPNGIEVDHVNTNGLDNQRSNLRLCRRDQNGKHLRLSCRNKSGFKGVFATKRSLKKPFYACIMANNKQIYLGYYRTAKEAAKVYDVAALKYHGAFALTNTM